MKLHNLKMIRQRLITSCQVHTIFNNRTTDCNVVALRHFLNFSTVFRHRLNCITNLQCTRSPEPKLFKRFQVVSKDNAALYFLRSFYQCPILNLNLIDISSFKLVKVQVVNHTYRAHLMIKYFEEIIQTVLTSGGIM